MMKYIIIVFVTVITVFIGGRSLNQAKAEKIVCAYACLLYTSDAADE